MHINEIENKITGVLLCNDVIGEIVCGSVKLLAYEIVCTKTNLIA